VKLAVLACLAALSTPAAACGGDSDPPPAGDDRGAGVGAFGGGARVETLARTRLQERGAGELAWVADEVSLRAGDELEHSHELAFVYARRGGHILSGDALEKGAGAVVPADAGHTHSPAQGASTFWEIRLAAGGSRAPRGARRVFESEALEGIPDGAAASLLSVTVPPRGGQTTVHTHPGPEFIYQLSGRIEYQNAIIGTKRLGPGGAEAIPPDTAVQKRNPFRVPATFLSWFLVDPDEPFAPKASF
jgi:quercetin dioxygenase-like cupin family protein